MKPIEHLAQECGATFGFISGEPAHHANRAYTFSQVELEALRQAIIKDFVNELEPVAWKWKARQKNGQVLARIENWNPISEHVETDNHVISDVVPLFNVSQWRDK